LHHYFKKTGIMRHALRASFYKNMTFKDKVFALLNEALTDRSDIFLIDITISDSYKIIVTLDGDKGVQLQDCIDISRAIENNLDGEEVDYALEVASVGVGSPLKLKRQYIKNIGRTLIVQLQEEKIEAELIQATEENITLTWEAREPKKIGKGKETVQKIKEIPYEDIKQAVVTVNFN
jgi:ribosome maturation factor RimP